MSMAVGQPARRQTDRIFFTGMAMATALTMFVGFSPTYFLRDPALPPLTTLYHLHGIVFTAWFLLFLAQTALVAAGRTDIHRRLGILGAVLAGVMVLLGIVVSIDTLRSSGGATGGPDPRVLLSIPLGSIIAFAALVSAAVALRRRSEAHKRLMLLASISMLSAAIGRIFIFAGVPFGPAALAGLFLSSDIFVAALVLYDLVARGRIHPASVWGGAGVVLFKPALLALAFTPPWLAFAEWLR